MKLLKAFATFWGKPYQRMNRFEKVAHFAIYPIMFGVGFGISHLFK